MVRPEGTLRCILCKGFVSFLSLDRFSDHMQHEHRAYFNTEFLLEASKLLSVNPGDFSVIRTIMQGMYEENIRSIVEEEKLERSRVGSRTDYRTNESLDDSGAVDTSEEVSSSLDMSASLEEMGGSMTESQQGELPVLDYEEVEEAEEDTTENTTGDSYNKIPTHLIDEFEKLCDSQRSRGRKMREDGTETANVTETTNGTETNKSTKSLFSPSSETRKSSTSLFSSMSNTLKRSFKQDEPKLGPVKMYGDGKVDFIKKKEDKCSKTSPDDKEDENGKTKNKPFECESCGKSFQLNFLLKKHIQSSHSNSSQSKNTHACPFCRKSFRFSLLLKRHVQYKHRDKHEKQNEKQEEESKSEEEEDKSNYKYPCEVCGRSFTQIGNMKRHMKTIHDDKALFNCDNCGKHFNQLVNLQRHRESHKGCAKKAIVSPNGKDRVYVESLV